MSKRFLKLNIDNDEADFLAFHHPNAFILLYFIARRARRTAGQPDGLNIGECHLGDWKSMGLSRQNYRTALNVLIVKKLLQIIETNRTRKKSATGITTTGTKVKLLSSVIWDINPEEDNHRPNHCPTTAQPLPNHEQDRIRKNKKDKEEQPPTPSSDLAKINFRENITLTKKEYDAHLALYGPEKFGQMLDILDDYKGASGKKYKSDYHVLKPSQWVVKRLSEDVAKGVSQRKFCPSSNDDEALKSLQSMNERAL